MNEHLKDLIYKAGFTGANFDYTQPGTCHETAFQNLLALMIEECVQVCKSRVGNSDYNTGRMHCASDLREHFGVKNEQSNL